VEAARGPTIISLLILLFILTIVSVIPDSCAITRTDYEVYPENLHRFDLIGFDEKGDVLHLTIIFKRTSDSGSEMDVRPIDIMIIEKSLSIQNIDNTIAEQEAMYKLKNVSQRIEKDIECLRDGQKTICFYHPKRDGDDVDWENSTVTLRIDYDVKETRSQSGFDWVKWTIILLVISVVIILIVTVIIFIKRRTRDKRSFFNPEEGPYYVFRSVAEDKVYYFTPEQYGQLYISNSLNDFDFLGTSTRIGGGIIPPAQEGYVQTYPSGDGYPMGQPMMAAPYIPPMEQPLQQSQAVQPGTYYTVGTALPPEGYPPVVQATSVPFSPQEAGPEDYPLSFSAEEQVQTGEQTEAAIEPAPSSEDAVGEGQVTVPSDVQPITGTSTEM